MNSRIRSAIGISATITDRRISSTHFHDPVSPSASPSTISAVRRHVSIMSDANTSLERHKRSVDTIAASVQKYYKNKEKFRIFHGSTNSTRPRKDRHSHVVDTSSLVNVLKVDVERMTALVEPNVPMDRLVEETLKYGLVPPVVMEFPGITVGGGYAGTSGESSSFKHGFFDRTINNVEIILANGDVVNCSASEKPDLFHGAAGTIGTLGITTLVKLQLREAKRYVETTYHPVSNMSEALQKIEESTSRPEVDYVDGIIFSKDKGAIITGRMTDNPEVDMKTQRFSGAKDPWFYLHVQNTITNHAGPITEAVPLAEYLFRYDRGGFWVGASAFKYFKMPFNAFTRWWLDDFLHTRMMYTALHASGFSRNYVIQDLALPFSTAEEFVDYTDKSFGIYPIWLCPLLQSPLPTMHPHSYEKGPDGKTQKHMLNIGLWGYGPPSYDEFVRINRDLETNLRRLGGMKWLYAHTYYSEDEFWEIYDKKWYEELRQKYDATSLPSVFEKVKVDVEAQKNASNSSMINSLLATWPFSGFYGIKKAIDSGSYLQARASAWKSIGEAERSGVYRRS